MRVLDIFTFLLITEICSLAIPRALSLRKKKLLKFISSEQFLIDLQSVTIEAESLVPTITEGPLANYGEGSSGIWKKKCDRNGGPKAYEIYNEVRPLKLNLLRLLGNAKQLPYETSIAREKGQLAPLFKNYCRRVPTIHKVEDYLTDSIRTCLNPEEKLNQQTFQNLGRSMLDYICEDEGHRLATFAASGGVDCIVTKYPALGICYHENIDIYIEAFKFASLDTRETLPVLGNEFRDKVEKFRDCTVKVFAECGNETATVVWNSTIVYLRDKIPNEDLPEEAQTFETGNYRPGTEIQNFDVPDEDVSNGDDSSDISFRKTCEHYGGPTAHDTALTSFQLVKNCSEFLVPKFTTVQYEAESFVISEKRCARALILNELEKYSVDSFKPCFRPKERRILDVFHNVFSSIRELICGEGDRFATAGSRIECLASRKDDILNCTQQNFGSYIRASGFRPKFETLTFFGTEFCTDLEKFRECSIHVLAECEAQIPLNLWESIFISTSKETACENAQEAQTLTDTEIPGTTSVPDGIGIQKNIMQEEWWPNNIYV